MARKKTDNETKLGIVRVAAGMFLERGYSNTSVRAIANDLNISSGNVTFYFPTKEHLLAVMTELLCDFQWCMMQKELDEGRTSLMAICLELVSMAAICQENETAKDLYLAAYTNPLSLEIIRRNDARRAKEVFGEYCTNWTDEQFREAEVLVSGIEYATLMTTDYTVPLEVRIVGALNQIMVLYNVPQEVRDVKIRKVLAVDYGSIGRRIFTEFTEYIDQINKQSEE